MTASPHPFPPLPAATALKVFVPFGVGYFLSYLYRSVNAVIAPDLVRDVGLDAAALGLLTSAYLFAFAAFQLPLGILLDRFGPRRTESALLVIAAVGAFVFAAGESAAALMVGRALIGLGVSACLMAAFKAFVVWFPAERLPTVNGLQLAAGGLGGLAATAPVEAALQLTDWRGLFAVVGALTLAAAAAIFLVVPERAGGQSGAPFRDQVRGVVEIFASPVFWHIVPFTVLSQATFVAIQGLWSGPWLRDVAGLDRTSVAEYLFLVAAAIIAGNVCIGALAERLNRRGVKLLTIGCTGMVLCMSVQTAIALEWTAAALALWMAFGFLGTAGIVVYPALSRAFPAELAGRVNTALNLLIFVAAFAFQWAIGAVIDLWPPTANGFAPQGYQVAWTSLLALQVMGLAWFGFARRRWDIRV